MKKTLALFLAVLMLFSVLSVGVFAADVNPVNTKDTVGQSTGEYSVTYIVRGAEVFERSSSTVKYGESAYAYFFANEGKQLPETIVVAIGNNELTADSYSYNPKTGKLVIPENVICNRVTVILTAEDATETTNAAQGNTSGTATDTGKKEKNGFWNWIWNWNFVADLSDVDVEKTADAMVTIFDYAKDLISSISALVDSFKKDVTISIV